MMILARDFGAIKSGYVVRMQVRYDMGMRIRKKF